MGLRILAFSHLVLQISERRFDKLPSFRVLKLASSNLGHGGGGGEGGACCCFFSLSLAAPQKHRIAEEEVKDLRLLLTKRNTDAFFVKALLYVF
jgi:hypothetical protein